MNRDLTLGPARLARSTRTAIQAFRLVDLVAQAHEPTDTQLDALSSAYFATSEFLREQPEFVNDLVEIHAHGSRQLGTIVRPRDGSREGFDIDLITRLHPSALGTYGGPAGPALLLSRLEAALRKYASAHGLSVQRHNRCVTLEYAGGMCADIAPVIDDPSVLGAYGASHALIPDRKLHRMESTNPRGYAKYFNEVGDISPRFLTGWTIAMDSLSEASIAPLSNPQEVFAKILCRLVQLVKLHRNAKFAQAARGADIAPTSIFLTTLVAEAYRVEAPLPHASPLELLLDIVERMPLHFQRFPRSGGQEEWYLADPAVPRGNLAEGMNSPGHQKAFFAWHELLITDIGRILNAIDGNHGMDAMLKAVKNAFGDRGSAAVATAQLAQQQTLRAAGKTAVFTTAAGSTMSAASTVTAASASSVSAPTARTLSSRAHTFFGR